MKKLVLCGALLLAVAVSASGQNPQKPGKWQVKMQMELPGMPIKMPAVNTEVCLTKEDLQDPQKAVPSDSKSKCIVSDYKIAGDTVTWRMECPKDKTKGNGEITFSADSYKGWMKMQMGEQEMTTKYTGTWKGECKK